MSIQLNEQFLYWENKAKIIGVSDEFKVKKEYITVHKINSTEEYKREIVILEEYIGNKTKIVIPPVNKIYSNAIRDNKYVERLYINADTICDIGFSCFENCTNLKEVEITTPLEVLPIHSFNRCYKLEFVKLPKSLKRISTSAFQNCYKLENIQLPNGLTYIDDLAFYNSGIREITLPETVTILGHAVFRDCTHLDTIIINSKKLRTSTLAKKSIIFDNVKTIIVRNQSVKNFVEKHLNKESKCKVIIQKSKT